MRSGKWASAGDSTSWLRKQSPLKWTGFRRGQQARRSTSVDFSSRADNFNPRRFNSRRTTAAIRILLLAVLLLLAALPPSPTASQTWADCGVVDEIRYPIDGINEARGDDFGVYRARFGGLHTGVDVAFYRDGDPVYAAARGRVTYSDPAGWDTEKGVVVVEHTFPGGEVFYTVYGHMEPANDYFFPAVGQCVTPESILGAVGRPSLSAPHLHFEVRSFNPDDGGPGYWPTNPAEAGWLHPLDFIRLWQARLANPAAYVSHVTALRPPGVPPLVMRDGGLIVADSAIMEGVDPAGRLRWRLELADRVVGMVGLDGDRALVRTADNRVLVLNAGRYEAVWTPDPALSGAPLRIGEAVTFLTTDNALAAYTPQGALLWVTPPLGERIAQAVVSPAGDRIAVGTRPLQSDPTPTWRVIDALGQMLYQVAPTQAPLAAFGPQGDYYLLDGATLYHIGADFTPTPLVRLPAAAARNAAMIADSDGNVYVFPARDGTLYAYDPSGALRWQTDLPGPHVQPPLLAAESNCLLYALGTDGTLRVFRTADGAPLGQASLYTGGANGHPAARLLEMLPGGQVRFGAGYLTALTLNGYALAGVDPGTCARP